MQFLGIGGANVRTTKMTNLKLDCREEGSDGLNEPDNGDGRKLLDASGPHVVIHPVPVFLNL